MALQSKLLDFAKLYDCNPQKVYAYKYRGEIMKLCRIKDKFAFTNLGNSEWYYAYREDFKDTIAHALHTGCIVYEFNGQADFLTRLHEMENSLEEEVDYYE